MPSFSLAIVARILSQTSYRWNAKSSTSQSITSSFSVKRGKTSPPPQLCNVSKKRAQNKWASHWEPVKERSESRCSAAWWMAHLKIQQWSEGHREHQSHHCDWSDKHFSIQGKFIPWKKARYKPDFHKPSASCTLHNIILKAFSSGKIMERTTQIPELLQFRMSLWDIN